MAVVRGAFTEILQPDLQSEWDRVELVFRLHLERKRCLSCGAPPSLDYPTCDYCGSVWSPPSFTD